MKQKSFKRRFIAVLMTVAMAVTMIPTYGFAMTYAEGAESEPDSKLSVANVSETGETVNGEEGEVPTEQDGQTEEFGIQVRINESDWRNVELLETTTKKSSKNWYNATGVLQSSDASLESFNTVKIRGINIPAGQKLVAGTSAVNNSYSFADNRKLSTGNQVDGLYSNTEKTTDSSAGARAGFSKGQGPAKETYYIYAYLADEVTEEIVDESKAWYIKIQRNGYEAIEYANMGFDAVDPLAVNTWSASDKAVSAMFGTMQYEQSVTFYNDIGDKKNGTLEVLDLNDEFSYDANTWSLKATRPGEHWMRWTCTYTNSDGSSVTKTADARIMARFEKDAVKYYIGDGTEENKGVIGNFLANYDETKYLVGQKKELEDKYQALVKEVNAWGLNNASIHVKRTDENPYGTTTNKNLADKDSRGAALRVCDVWADDINAMLDAYEELQTDICGQDYAIEQLKEMKKEHDSKRCAAIIDDAITQIEELNLQAGDAKAKIVQRILNRAEADIQAEEETENIIDMLKESVAMLKAELISPNAKAVASSTKSVKISWTTSHYADGYELSKDNGKTWKTVSGTQMSLSGLRPATTYTYKIRGYVRSDGKVYNSKVSTARVTTPLAKAGKPKVKSKSRRLTVSWSRVEGASRYQVWIGTNSSVTKGVIKYSTSSLSKTSKKLKYKKNYYVKVRAYKGNVYGAWSTVKKIKCK